MILVGEVSMWRCGSDLRGASEVALVMCSHLSSLPDLVARQKSSLNYSWHLDVTSGPGRDVLLSSCPFAYRSRFKLYNNSHSFNDFKQSN